ncbi:MAG: MurR/RpiR family transcriptional regulator [Caldimonas sp.]
MAPVALATATEPDVGEVILRIGRDFDALPPQVSRAARWLVDHAGDVALLSMREQARSAGVSAPTMVRLARALGFADYGGLRRPFQSALRSGRAAAANPGRYGRYGRRASALQAAPAGARIGRLAHEMVEAQVEDVRSVEALNAPAQIEAVVKTLAKARRVGFLGVRSSFAIAFYFRYGYNLIATNGVLFDGLGGFLLDQAEALERGDVLVAISQAPYSAPTVRAMDAAQRRGVTLVALTDSELSPLARLATHTLLLRTESLSFFPSMSGPLALVEVLLAGLAARGGKKVLRRLADVDGRLAASQAYWPERARLSRMRAAPRARAGRAVQA